MSRPDGSAAYDWFAKTALCVILSESGLRPHPCHWTGWMMEVLIALGGSVRGARESHVVIVGAGFGGLAAARGLRRAPVRITIIDRSNHHLFQPLLYQVATAALSPADIAAPIRRIFRHQPNVAVMLADATAVDVPEKRVVLADGAVELRHPHRGNGSDPCLFRPRRLGRACSRT